MALNIRNPKTEKLAAELAALTGESKTEAVTQALAQRLKQVRKQSRRRHLAERLNEIALHCASLPELLDKGSAEDLLYNDLGLPA